MHAREHGRRGDLLQQTLRGPVVSSATFIPLRLKPLPSQSGISADSLSAYTPRPCSGELHDLRELVVLVGAEDHVLPIALGADHRLRGILATTEPPNLAMP